jgi:hypothetical protein
MTNSILLRTLQKFDKKDLRALCELSTCGQFNRRPEVTRLCDYLAEQLPRYDASTLTPEKLFAAAFPSEIYDNKRLRHTMSFLLEVVREYLLISELKNDAATENVLICKALRRRGLDDLFEKEWDYATTMLEKSAQHDAPWHLAQFQIWQEKIESITPHERSKRLDMRPLQNHLTVYYLSEMLRFAVSALTHKAVSGQGFDEETLQAALDLAATSDWLSYPTIAVYYSGCRALLEPTNAAHFTALKAAVAQHSEKLSSTEQRTMYLLCINYCIQQMNRGERQYISEAFDLYKVALKRDLLAENGYLTGFTYKNIIRVGTALGEHDWVKDFFENKKTALHPREREQLYQYNKAYLFFQKGDYAQAMPMLQQLDLDDRLNLLDARRMLLRSYFELQEWKALESLLGSFGTYLQRQKDLGYHREMYLNLVRFTQKIMDLKQQSRVLPKVLADLRIAIEGEKQVAERAWLLEQLG